MLQHPLGEISLHEARVEEVERSCDSDSDDTSMPDYTLAVWPPNESPTYLMITTRPEKVRGHSVMSMLTASFVFFWALTQVLAIAKIVVVRTVTIIDDAT